MAKREPQKHYAPDPNILERRAGAYLKQLNRAERLGHRERNPEEIAALGSTERHTVILAAAAGILSGVLIGGGEVYVRLVVIGDEDAGWLEHWRVWLVFLAAAGIVSAVEIAFLYWNALRGIARLTRISGVSLAEEAHAEIIARGLARAGLEFPNPRDPVYGVDAYAYVPNWRLTAQNILYKMKVGVSSFLLRLFMRRVLGRMMVRGLVPLIAGPLYAAWNALITWRISREARVRALGPFAVDNLIAEVKAERDDLGDEARELLVQAAGEMMRRNQDAHPNYVILLYRLTDVLAIDTDTLNVDWDTAQQSLVSLRPEEQSLVLDVLTLSAMLGTRVRRGQTALARDACGQCGRTFDEDAFAGLRSAMIEGRRIDREDIRQVGRAAGDADAQAACAQAG